MKKVTSILASAALAVALVPAGALAPGAPQAHAATAGAFTVTGGASGTDYSYSSGVLTVNSATSLTIKNTDPNTATSDRIVVQKDVSANITLAGVNVSVGTNRPAFQIENNSAGNVNITLAAGSTNTLQGGNYNAGLAKGGLTNVGKLTIQGSGSLTANGGDRAPGIGGTDGSSNTANIEIAGGNIEVNGQYYAAGIGSASGGSASNITISGGNLKVSSGLNGAGIGSGYGSGVTASNITVSGGTVSVEVHKDISRANAAIGNGSYGTASNIKVTGGSLKFSGDSGFSSFGATPTDASGNEVQLIEISNPESRVVKIDGNVWTPYNHTALDSTDTTLYAYLSKADHTIAIGNTQTSYTYENGQFVPSGSISLTNPVTLRVNSSTNHWEVSYDDGFTWEEVQDDKGQPVTATGGAGATPQLLVSDDGYWQVSYDGSTWIDVTDASGNRVQATGNAGAAGATGAAGADGKDGVTPQLKVDADGSLLVSYDGGATFSSLGAKVADAAAVERARVESSSVKSLKVTAKKGRKAKVSWKAPKGIAGLSYQVRYKKKGSAKWTVKKVSKTKLTVKKLKAGKKYQFQVRGYKNVDGKRVYTDWESSSWVKAKK